MNRAAATLLIPLLLMVASTPVVLNSANTTLRVHAATPTPAASSSSSSPYFTLYISYYGINMSSKNTTITVTQGAEVTIEFVWNDSALGFDNAHQMEVEGYGIISDVIDQENPTSVVQFVASQSGTFQIHCVIPCQGMNNMQNGWLQVNPSGGSTTTSSSTSSTSTTTSRTSTSSSSSASTTQTTSSTGSASSSTTSVTTATTTVVTSSGATITTTAQSSTSTASQSSSSVSSSSSSASSTTTSTTTTSTTTTTATTQTKEATVQVLSLILAKGGFYATDKLADTSGNPIAHASIAFTVLTDFGVMSIGTATTGTNGSAKFTSPSLSSGWTELNATYKGNTNYNASRTTLLLNGAALAPKPNSASPYISGQEPTVDLRLIGVPQLSADAVVDVFLTIVACVYLVFIIVVVTVFGIRRKSSVGK